jgi:hypothetical protein
MSDNGIVEVRRIERQEGVVPIKEVASNDIEGATSTPERLYEHFTAEGRRVTLELDPRWP